MTAETRQIDSEDIDDSEWLNHFFLLTLLSFPSFSSNKIKPSARQEFHKSAMSCSLIQVNNNNINWPSHKTNYYQVSWSSSAINRSLNSTSELNKEKETNKQQHNQQQVHLNSK